MQYPVVDYNLKYIFRRDVTSVWAIQFLRNGNRSCGFAMQFSAPLETNVWVYISLPLAVPLAA